MNKEAKAAWLTALRSGYWKQGKGALRCGDKYCCLGVLCDLGEKKAWIKTSTSIYRYEDDMNYLPEEVAKPAGLTRREQKMLATLNDEGKTFDEIADFIEENL